MSGNGTLAVPWDFPEMVMAPQIKPGDTIHARAGTYAGEFQTTWVDGESGAQIILQPYLAELPVIDGGLDVSSIHVLVKGFHIRNSDFLDRLTETPGANPPDIPVFPGLRATVNEITFQDCIIENCANGGYVQTGAVNIILDGCYFCHIGWDTEGVDADRPHGHGLYASATFVTVKNCIAWHNFEFGIKIYSEGGGGIPIDDCVMQDNIVFRNSILHADTPGTHGNLLYGSFDQVIYRPNWTRNYTYQLAADSTASNHFGYNKSFHEAVMVDNYLPDGLVATDTPEWGSDYTQYSGNVLTRGAANVVKVIAVRERLHVAIYNWELNNTVSVDVSALFTNGQTLRVINVQSFDPAQGDFTDTQTLVVSGGAVTVNMQAINRTIGTPQGWTAPATSFPEFGCFIIKV